MGIIRMNGMVTETRHSLEMPVWWFDSMQVTSVRGGP